MALIGIVVAVAWFAALASSDETFEELSAAGKRWRAFQGYVIMAILLLSIDSCVFQMPPDPLIDYKPDGACTF